MPNVRANCENLCKMVYTSHSVDANLIQTCKDEHLRAVMGPVAIFWDIENCPVPGEASAQDVAGNLRMALRVHPAVRGSVTMFSAYGDFNRFPKKLREGCQRTGVNLIDVPNGKKDPSDKAILVDMFLFALDNPPPCTIFLISGDVDFASALHKLGQRGYTIVLAVPSGGAAASPLCSAGRYVWDWPSVARGGGLIPAKAFQFQELFSEGSGTSKGAYLVTSDDPDHPKDEIVSSESSKRKDSKSKGYFAQSSDYVEPEQYNSLIPETTTIESSLHSVFPSSTVIDWADLNSKALSVDFDLPQNCPWSSAAAAAAQFGKPHILDWGIEADKHKQVQSTSHGGEYPPTSWVRPGDLQGLKLQIVKLLSLHGGRLKLLSLPVEYCKLFARPLCLVEYKSTKLVDLIEKMRDFIGMTGKGSLRTLHLTKSGHQFATKHKRVWETYNSARIMAENSSTEEVSVSKSPEIGYRLEGNSGVHLEIVENQRVSASSSDSDSSSVDEKGVAHEEREDTTNFEIQPIAVCAEQHEASLRLESFKHELQELLVSNACTIPVSNFLSLYQLKYARPLDYIALGFQSIESLFEKVQDVIIVKEEQGMAGKFLVARSAVQTNHVYGRKYTIWSQE